MRQVTCILVNYKGAQDVAAAAQTVLADAPQAHVVVVDNSECAQEAGALRTALPAAAELLVAPHNMGFGAACNWAAKHAPAAFYWLVNPDVRVVPGCLSQLLATMAADAGLGAVAPAQFLDEGKAWLFSPSWLPTALGSWAREVASQGGVPAARYGKAVRAESVRAWAAAAQGGVVPQRALSGAAMLVRHESLHAVHGLFDPAYFMYFEDSDMCIRLRRTGWRMAMVAGAQVVHLWQLGGHKQGLMAAAAPVYFSRNFPESPWLTKAPPKRPAACGPARQLLQWPSGQALPVPDGWQSGWSLELSVLPVFLPAVGQLGTGGTVAWPWEAVKAVEGAALFARLGPLNGAAGDVRVLALGG